MPKRQELGIRAVRVLVALGLQGSALELCPRFRV